MPTREIKYMHPDEIRAERERCPLAFLPLGPLEWHGPHLPFGTDPLNAEAIALRLANALGGVVFPTLFWGTERERDPQSLGLLGFAPDEYIVGMDFPANSVPSGYCAEDVFGVVVREQLRVMQRMGYRLALIISGHGASNHMQALERLAVEYSHETPLRASVAVPFACDAAGVQRVGHASRIETAMIQAQFPHLVRIERLPALPAALRNVDHAVVDYLTFGGDPTPGRTVHDEDDPRHASAAEGMETVQEVVRQLCARWQPLVDALARVTPASSGV